MWKYCRALVLPTENTKQAYKGLYLSFNLNLNLPPPCTTGYLPPIAAAAAGRSGLPRSGPPATCIAGCLKIPDSTCVVRATCRVKRGRASGLPRSPCAKATRTTSRSTTATTGRATPTRTLSGQAVPQPPPGTPGSTAPPGPAPPPIAVAQYDPASGTYIGPDGQQYTQKQPRPRRRKADLAEHADAAEGKLIDEPQNATVTAEPVATKMNAIAARVLGELDGFAGRLEDSETPVETLTRAKPTVTNGTATRWTPPRVALIAGVLVVAMLAAMTGWLGFRQSSITPDRRDASRIPSGSSSGRRKPDHDRLATRGRRCPRILDTATGTFHENFAKRAQPFIDVVKQAQSKSEGTVVSAGLESVTADAAQVLVAMNVKTTNLGSQETAPRAWRMRIDVQKKGNDMKVSDVEFVP